MQAAAGEKMKRRKRSEQEPSGSGFGGKNEAKEEVRARAIRLWVRPEFGHNLILIPHSLRPCYSTAEWVPILCRILFQDFCPSSCKP